MSTPYRSELIDVVDSKGQPGTVECWTTPVQHRPLSGQTKILNGHDEYLFNGQSVNKLRDGNFKVVQTDEILKPLERES